MNVNNNKPQGKELFKTLKFFVPENLHKTAKGAQIAQLINLHGGKRDFVTISEESILIYENFLDDEFNKYKDLGRLIIGVPYFNECVRDKIPIDVDKVSQRPLYSNCFKDFKIALIGFEDSGREILEFYILSMGAEVVKAKQTPLGLNITHLIAHDNTITNTSRIAKNFGIPILGPKWIKSCYSQAKVVNIDPYKHLLLSGFDLSISGFPGDQRQQVMELITANGGTFSTTFGAKSHYLLSNGAQTAKTQYAQQWKVPIVSLDWITDSVAINRLLDEGPYTLSLSPSDRLNNLNNSSSKVKSTLVPKTNIDINKPQPIKPISHYNPSTITLVKKITPTPYNKVSPNRPQQLNNNNNNNNNENDNNQLQLLNDQNVPGSTQNQLSLVLQKTNIFREKIFMIKQHGTDFKWVYDHIVPYVNSVVDSDELPSTIRPSNSMRIDYILVPHEIVLTGSNGSIPTVTLDWFDKCINDEFIYDPSSCLIFQPVKSTTIFLGLRISAVGFNDINFQYVKMSVKGLGSKFYSHVNQYCTHIIVPNNSLPSHIKSLIPDNIPIHKFLFVYENWVNDSCKSGSKLKETNYRLNIGNTTNSSQNLLLLENNKNDNSSLVLPDDDNNFMKFQTISRTNSQLFNPSSSSKNTPTNSLEIESMKVDIPVKNENDQDNNMVIDNTTIVQPTQSITNPIGKLIDSLNFTNNLNTPNLNNSNSIIPVFKKPTTTSIILHDKILTLDSISENDQNNKDDTELSDEGEYLEDGNNYNRYGSGFDENSQMVTYGDPDSESRKRQKLIEHSLSHNNHSMVDQQQHLLDLLNKQIPPPQPPPVLSTSLQKIKPLINQPTNGFTLPLHSSPLSEEATDQQYHFVLSGFVKEENNKATIDVTNLIVKLGGVVDNQYIPNVTTHLITCSPLKSEKMLSSCAAGIWVLTEEYCTAIKEKNRFVNEEPYEWDEKHILPNQRAQPTTIQWANAPKLCRKSVQAAKGKKLFANCSVAIIKHIVKNSEIWDNILKSGGAKVVHINSHQEFQQTKHLTHMFTNSTKSKTEEVQQYEKIATHLKLEIVDTIILTDLIALGNHLSNK